MRKMIALVLYIAVGGWLLLAALYALSLSSSLFNRNFYSEVLDNPNLYENDVLLRAITAGVVEDVTDVPGFSAVHPETVDAYATAFATVLPGDYARDEAEQAADEILAYVDGETDTLNITFDVRPFQDALSEEAEQTEFATVLAENLPVCERNQDPYATGFVLPVCRASGVGPAALEQEILDAMPDYLNVPLVPAQLQADIPFQQATDVVRVVMTVGMVVAVVVLLLIAWLGGRTLRGALVWLGLLGVLPAIAVLMTGISIRSGIADSRISSEVNSINFREMTVSQEFRDALSETFVNAASLFSEGFLTVGLVALLVALAVAAVGYVLPRADDSASSRVSVIQAS
jgi:hypothetical protein